MNNKVKSLFVSHSSLTNHNTLSKILWLSLWNIILLIKPSYYFTIIPNTLSNCSICINHFSFSLLFSFLKISFIFFSICKSENSKTMFLILKKRSFIKFSIRPFIYTFSFHIIIFKLSLINFMICKLIYSFNLIFNAYHNH